MKGGMFLIALLLVGSAHAQNYRWIDQDGKVHYGDRPPPTANRVEARTTQAPAADTTLPYAVQQAIANFPVTLHVTADCAEGCKEGRDYLKSRGIPFNEKNVTSNEDIEALKKLVGGGEAFVPVLQVGSRHAKGWLRGDWQRLLDAAGYPKEKR